MCEKRQKELDKDWSKTDQRLAKDWTKTGQENRNEPQQIEMKRNEKERIGSDWEEERHSRCTQVAYSMDIIHWSSIGHPFVETERTLWRA